MIGERIRQARLAAGLTQDEVVGQLEGLGVVLSKQALSKYELGKTSPTASFLLKLGQSLGVSASFFFEEPQLRIEWLGYRKKSTLKQHDQDRVKAIAETTVESILWLQQRLQATVERRPLERLELKTGEDAERAAERVRHAWGLGDLPIESLTETIEDTGGIIVEINDAGADFDGLSAWLDGVAPLAILNRAVPDDRRRFSLAHELGHLVMRYRLPGKEDEKMANRFAGALLMPATAAFRELGRHRRHLSMSELRELKMKYGMSMQAICYRAKDLEIIDAGHATSLYQRFSALGWRRQEPVKFEGREEAMRLRQLTMRAVAEGVITMKRAEQLSPGCTDPDTIEEMGNAYTAQQLLRMNKGDRDRILEAAAAGAVADYEHDKQLTDFEAFSDDDTEG